MLQSASDSEPESFRSLIVYVANVFVRPTNVGQDLFGTIGRVIVYDKDFMIDILMRKMAIEREYSRFNRTILIVSGYDYSQFHNGQTLFATGNFMRVAATSTISSRIFLKL
jgi:hypothetical protein